MRSIALALLLTAATPALAQDRGVPNLDRMNAADAARLNQAVREAPQARQALDKVESHLKEHGHRAGTLLERTRP